MDDETGRDVTKTGARFLQGNDMDVDSEDDVEVEDWAPWHRWGPATGAEDRCAAPASGNESHC